MTAEAIDNSASATAKKDEQIQAENPAKSEPTTEEIKFVRKFQRLPPQVAQLDDGFLAWKRGFWREKIDREGIKNVVAPMVDQSELAFRMLCRKYSAHLCYTPMIHAQLFATDPTYRRLSFSTVDSDRPLIVQFCANDPEMLLTACRLVEGFCDGVDLNLGCPQVIAKKGHYGAFLQESPDLIEQMISLVHRHCRLPISAKIRMLNDLPSTIEYAKRIERAGAALLTIHGRTREQKGVNTGLADWQVIKALKHELKIPVFANGNIQMPGDVDRCMAETGADGVMSAEGVLSNPLLLHGQNRFCFDVAEEYLDFAERFEAPFSAVRAHIFRICHYSFLKYDDLRDRNALCCSLQEFRQNIGELRLRCLEEMRTEGVQYGENPWAEAVQRCFPDTPAEEIPLQKLVQLTPHYFCKPYVRPAPTSSEEDSPRVVSTFRQQKRDELERLVSETGLSRRQIRKRAKRQLSRQKQQHRKQSYPKCVRCEQPAGSNCGNGMCRRCCKFACARGIKPGCKTHCFDHETMKAKHQLRQQRRAEQGEQQQLAQNDEQTGGQQLREMNEFCKKKPK